jgi:hypothetical protein
MYFDESNAIPVRTSEYIASESKPKRRQKSTKVPGHAFLAGRGS